MCLQPRVPGRPWPAPAHPPPGSGVPRRKAPRLPSSPPRTPYLARCSPSAMARRRRSGALRGPSPPPLALRAPSSAPPPAAPLATACPARGSGWTMGLSLPRKRRDQRRGPRTPGVWGGGGIQRHTPPPSHTPRRGLPRQCRPQGPRAAPTGPASLAKFPHQPSPESTQFTPTLTPHPPTLTPGPALHFPPPVGPLRPPSHPLPVAQLCPYPLARTPASRHPPLPTAPQLSNPSPYGPHHSLSSAAPSAPIPAASIPTSPPLLQSGTLCTLSPTFLPPSLPFQVPTAE